MSEQLTPTQQARKNIELFGRSPSDQEEIRLLQQELLSVSTELERVNAAFNKYVEGVAEIIKERDQLKRQVEEFKSRLELFGMPAYLVERDMNQLRAQNAELLTALHECYRQTGEEAGDIDDFKAL